MHEKEAQFKILLVEDNPGDVRLVEIFLGESDLRDSDIVNHKTLGGALEALSNIAYDVILLDFNLPDSNGFETLYSVLEAYPKANVIVFTGMEDKQLGIKAVQAGAQDYLVKGDFGADFLVKTLRYAIERNRNKIRLEAAQREANKINERYTRVFTQSKDTICISTESGAFVDFNQATIKLFGYSQEELSSGVRIDDLYQNKEDRLNLLEKLKEDGHVHDYPVNLVRKDGEVRQCLITSNLVNTEDGHIEYHSIIRDITEQKEAEELKKQQELKDKENRLKEQLLTTVSHEMRTPMNAVMGMVGLLLKTKVTAEQHDYLTSVQQSSEHLQKMINDILEHQKIQFDKIKLENDNFDLYDILTNLINIQHSTEKNVLIETIIDPAVERFVYGDQKRLNQILINLVGNAIKFTEEGTVSIAVKTLETNDKKIRLEFAVRDTGIGMPEDKLETIFEPFVRVRDKQKKFYEGIGLGLSIVKMLIEKMDGSIVVTSKLDEGSAFTFDVLLEKGQEQKPTEVKPATPVRKPLNGGGGTKQILLVEDNRMNQIVAVKHIEGGIDHVKVDVAENGQIAIDKMQEKNYDLILMDIQMPVMDGFETTTYIRNKMPEPHASLPILAMTAHAHFLNENKYKEYDMQDCIIKPFKPEELCDKISYYLYKDDDEGQEVEDEKKNNPSFQTQ